MKKLIIAILIMGLLSCKKEEELIGCQLFEPYTECTKRIYFEKEKNYDWENWNGDTSMNDLSTRFEYEAACECQKDYEKFCTIELTEPIYFDL